ncbi:MAG TPA: hypothetical protein VGD74_01670 [Vulgatibacter sp.]
MRHVALLAIALGAGACGTPSLNEAATGVEVDTTSRSFPDTWIGFTAKQEILVRNLGRASLSLTTSVAPPFQAPGALQVPGASDVLIPVDFSPRSVGPHSGRLEISIGAEKFVVALSGIGLEVPTCDPGDECSRFVFDPASGGCRPDPVPNGTSCGSACIDAGTCRDGVCVGDAVGCEPGDACTAIECDPTEGCVAHDIAATCPPSDDPCSAPICDRVKGCGFEAAPDGTICGKTDCSSAEICLQGVCTLSESPDGGPCGEESPCQEKGVCRRGVCIQPPKTELLQAWTSAAIGRNRIFFGGTTDPDGNLFWAECDPARCELVKATADGFELYRKPMSDGTASVGALALAGERLVSTLRPGWLEAYDARRGDLLWSLDLAASLRGQLQLGTPAAPAQDLGWVEVREPVVHGSLVAVLAEAFSRTPTIDRLGSWVVGLDLLLGEVRWTRAFDGTFEGLVGDSSGRLYFATLPSGSAPSDPAFLVSLGPSGGDRWTVGTAFRGPLAAAGSLLLQASGLLRAGDDGTPMSDLDVMIPLVANQPLLSGRHGWVFGFPMGDCDGRPCPIWTPKLFSFDPQEGVVLGALDVSGGDSSARTEPILTSTGGIIFAEVTGSVASGCLRTWRLMEIDAGGNKGFECMLPGGRYGGPASLSGGRWAVLDTCGNHAIKVFTLKGYETAPQGWVTARGSPGRTGKPR